MIIDKPQNMLRPKVIYIFSLCLFYMILSMSCSQTNGLTVKDYEWMPYKENETLIFKSNTGDNDTIFLLEKAIYWRYPYPSVSLSKYEEIAIFCKHSDPYVPKGENRYLKNSFFEIGKTMDNRAEINILLVAKDAVFYRRSPIKIDSLDKVKPLALQTASGKYNDVYVINGEDYLGTFHQRSDFVTKLYWSKSYGLVRYDKKNAIYWELVSKK